MYKRQIPTNAVKIANNPTTVINTNYFSSAGLFVGLIMAIISTEVYHFIAVSYTHLIT